MDPTNNQTMSTKSTTQTNNNNTTSKITTMANAVSQSISNNQANNNQNIINNNNVTTSFFDEEKIQQLNKKLEDRVYNTLNLVLQHHQQNKIAPTTSELEFGTTLHIEVRKLSSTLTFDNNLTETIINFIVNNNNINRGYIKINNRAGKRLSFSVIANNTVHAQQLISEEHLIQQHNVPILKLDFSVTGAHRINIKMPLTTINTSNLNNNTTIDIITAVAGIKPDLFKIKKLKDGFLFTGFYKVHPPTIEANMNKKTFSNFIEVSSSSPTTELDKKQKILEKHNNNFLFFKNRNNNNNNNDNNYNKNRLNILPSNNNNNNNYVGRQINRNNSHKRQRHENYNVRDKQVNHTPIPATGSNEHTANSSPNTDDTIELSSQILNTETTTTTTDNNNPITTGYTPLTSQQSEHSHHSEDEDMSTQDN